MLDLVYNKHVVFSVLVILDLVCNALVIFNVLVILYFLCRAQMAALIWIYYLRSCGAYAKVFVIRVILMAS